MLLFLSPVETINVDIAPYYESYMHFVEANCDKTQYRYPLFLTMQFDNLLKRGIVGETVSYSYKLKLSGYILHFSDIAIDSSDWNISNRSDRVALVFHELTHALFHYPDLYEEQYRYHFMFFSKEHLKEEDVKLQLVYLLGYLCHK
jgi:hypothetical protein